MEAPETGLPLLRFITCGSVDDGKSTLIGRLLHESHCIFEDQLHALVQDSRKYGTQGSDIDFALLVDGLQAEREQGITIDVAYRFFNTGRRQYIVADAPGHEQYTRNMATGASTAELAIILVDARKGVLTQTRRHTRIVAMMGIRHVVLAINKIDLIAYVEADVRAIEKAYREFCEPFGFASLAAIPLSALHGENVVARGERMPWYRGPVLVDYLDSHDARHPACEEDEAVARPLLRMPVQWVNRPNPGFRGLCGRIAQGSVQPGDAICVMPGGVRTRVKDIVSWNEARSEASEGDAVTLTLADEVDASRGDVVCAEAAPPEIADQFEARLLWMSHRPMLPGRSYFLKIHFMEVSATVTAVKHREDVDTGAHLAATSLGLNEIGLVNLSLSRAVVFEPYAVNRILGGFILIDKFTLETVGAGMLLFALRRAANVQWQALDIDKAARAAAKHQAPRCIWFTGLSGSGKSTLANLLEKRLHAEGRHTYLLDGDNVRHGLNRDLGFTEAARVENIRRVAEVAKLMVDAGLVVLVSFISPFRSEREFARSLFAPGEFVEVFVDAPLVECERRDAKGLYARARRGELSNFTGIDSPYDVPERPELHLKTDRMGPEACLLRMLETLNG